MPRQTPRRARALRAAAVGAAHARALPAHAAQTAQTAPAAQTAPQKARAKKSPAAAPAEVLYPAASTTEAVISPPAGVVVVQPSRGRPSIGIGVGAWSGLEIGKGLALQADFGLVRTPASWSRLELEWRLAIMFAAPTEETDLTRLATTYPPTYVVSGFEKTTAYVVEVAPTARIRLPLGPALAIFVDAGAGIAQSMDTYERDEMFVGRTVKKENVTGLVFRGGLGVSYDASERLRVLLIPLAGSKQVGPKYSAYEPTLAVAFRL